MIISPARYSVGRGVMIVLVAVAALTNAMTANSANAKIPRHPASSRIIELYDERAGHVSPGRRKRDFDQSGFKRPDIIGYVYADKFELVPATGLDNIRYFAQAVGDLAARCPSLGLDAAKHELAPYVLSSAIDFVRRFQTGQLSQSEVLQTVWMGMLGLNRYWSCQYDPATGPIGQAQARCDEAAKDRGDLILLPSLDAAHDMTLFLGRYGCEREETQHLARQMVAFGRIAHSRRLSENRLIYCGQA